MRQKHIKYPIIVGVLILLFQASTVPFTLYEKLPLLDIPMHFAGGFVAAWFFAIYFTDERKKVSRLTSLMLIIGAAAIIGVSWEWFEWLLDNFIFTEIQFMGGLDDTLFDLFMDLAGAAAIALLYNKKKTT